jgi:predicted amidohydrolase YtcJ
VELPGAMIMPGFIDTHVHLTSSGLSLANEDVAAATNKDELLEIARRRAAEGGGVVWLQGYDETRWTRPELPSVAELDAVTDRPLVVFRADGHVGLANAAALKLAAIEAEGVDLDDAGAPSGGVRMRALQELHAWAAESMDRRTIEELQLRAAGVAAARGITAVHEMSMPDWYGIRDLEVFLGHRGLLPVDAIPIVATTDVPLVIAYGLQAIGGDLPIDGSIGARTAALHAPYAEGPGRGVVYFEDDQLVEFFHSGHNAGLQVGIHAIGDRAIELVLTAWERVYQALDSRERRHFRARRHRVEHFEMPTSAHVERAAMLGLAVSVQPTFDRLWGFPGSLYETALGARAETMNPFRSMLERGVVLGAGSDAPVTPLDPWLTVTAMETHHHPAQRLSRAEAVQVHTAGSARLGHLEEKKGVLEPGMHADFAVYEVDPFEADTVEGLRPILTVSLGRDVYAA